MTRSVISKKDKNNKRQLYCQNQEFLQLILEIETKEVVGTKTKAAQPEDCAIKIKTCIFCLVINKIYRAITIS